ncbi:MAG: N-alpha-acetyl diaminobutyric acid deacetylase DoeB [Alphaproteobacteria bacterium]|jgi:N2-acetyl-L-2,4-diaminobutanoate deacetylase|nr:N-alpha-acetyl diaminobutyric acid deacetylase DoeB [Alphaproteobacteria bacterium]MBT4085885.1 N-alpha-acetyl diaminobutyric acid deacetylase DoeB [Alphaproteobacteria bacterium]MBT4542642.1 N-alpha-acetyl diaminobutyric acid deacetylase DoeB [Alphaproteobacteria bacterium]MBT6384852.1 N-alpha-acetyl diaminobutyric acid deacetylase DoeB [Alphaproteobacteria bacterium]MBT7746846.1 N-alpha-acetyl diaminobutyric acid deacetylase DoeB [Alphaproteobacteria bacterium]
MQNSPITATVDFEADGVQHGFFKLPHSHDGSAWGSIMIPVTVAKNGDGPTVLLTGGNHGDEYEGPIALIDLAATIKAKNISGRVIIIPGMNYPAFQAGTRTSPIDKGNLNRFFPGNPAGSITEKIADYFQRTLLPLADFVVDIHSGGKTLDFVPFCAAHVLEDKDQQARCVAAMQAFNAPWSMMLLEIDAVGMYDTAAEDMGKVFISTELGGGGSARAETVAIAKKGVRNVLKHAGVLEGNPDLSPTINIEMPDDRCFVTSETSGLLEVCVDLGDTVRKGQTLARVHDMKRTGSDPVVYVSPIDGIFTARHFPGLIGMGDIVAVIAVPA